jgi:hypothetical protein
MGVSLFQFGVSNAFAGYAWRSYENGVLLELDVRWNRFNSFAGLEATYKVFGQNSIQH